MKSLSASILVFFCSLPVICNAADCNDIQTPLVGLLDQYSQSTGTKFVIDPRVRAKVTLIGIDTTNLDATTLIGILNIHGFAALTANGIVYVMPKASAGSAGEQYGVPWEG